MLPRGRPSWAVLLLALRLGLAAVGAGSFRVATYNLEGYVDAATATRPAKSPESKAKVREQIRALRPDILAVQEVGSASALLELQKGLQSEGVDLPYFECVSGSDTNIHVAVLSRWPFSAFRPHTNLSFLLGGRRFHVSRGFCEVVIQLNQGYSFTLLAVHLKSRRAVPQADESDLRFEEAKLLREIIESRLNANPHLNLVALGDFNDTKDSPAIRAIIGRGRNKLVDTQPAERSCDPSANSDPTGESRKIMWTHYFSKEDTYSRIDYIFLSPGMARAWLPAGTFVLACPNWGLASDHRPVIAEFQDMDPY